MDDWNKLHPTLKVMSHPKGFDDYDYNEMMTSEVGTTAYNAMNVYRNRLIPFAKWDSATQNFSRKWESWKADNQFVDFTDMVANTLASGYPHPNLPDIMYMDESQDCTPLILKLFREWGKHTEQFWLVGDDDQCIFEHQGADPDYMRRTIPVRKDYLKNSHRVPRAVHKLATKWIERCSSREAKPYNPRDAEGEVRHISANWHTPDMVTNAFRGRVGTKMFLATCQYMLVPMLCHCKEKGIPFANKYRKERVDWNPLGPGTAASRLRKFLQPSEKIYGNEARPWSGDELSDWSAHIESGSVFSAGKKDEAKKLAGKEPMSIDEILQFIPEHTLKFVLNLMYEPVRAAEWYAKNVIATKRKSYAYPIRVMKNAGVTAINARPELLIGTIHSCKGGQSDTVVLAPDMSKAGMMNWMGTRKQQDSVRRQFYVGMTRARESLLICEPASQYQVEL